MTLTVILLVWAVATLAFLLSEHVRLARSRRAIPLRIAVTGTRGKSTVTRMLAAVLRESSRKVLAKTTGSEAIVILPDGVEQTVKRRGRPSIMEQKRLIHLGAELGVDTAVVEIMSIHAENHFVEAQQLIEPHVVLVTNFRADHTAAMGDTPEEVASVIAVDVPHGAQVFVPARQSLPDFRLAAADRGAGLTEVPPGPDENVDLVYAAARSLGVNDEVIRRGVERTRYDIGALAVWRYPRADADRVCHVVNAFAANDPESTMLVHERVMTTLNADAGRCVGLMNLREDRADRTVQWAEALVNGALDRFCRLYVCGLHAPALVRRLRGNGSGVPVEVIRKSRPTEIMKAILGGVRDTPTVVFGFGNMAGLGEALVAHWMEAGDPLDRLTARPTARPA